MAQGQIVDYNLLYKVGQAKGYKPDKWEHVRKAAGYVMEKAADHLFEWGERVRENNATAAKNSAKLTGEITNSATGAPEGFSAKSATAARNFQSQYREGQKLMNRNRPGSKQYLKGAELQNNAALAMKNMKSDLDAATLKWKEEQDRVKNGGPNALNKGAIIDQRSNSSELASGNMWGAMDFDPATGKLFVGRTQEFSLDELIEQGHTAHDARQLIDSGGNFGELEKTNFTDMEFAQNANTTAQEFQTLMIKNSRTSGQNGQKWTNSWEQQMRAEVKGAIGNMDDNSFRSYFFGGTSYDHSGGTNPESSPAHRIIMEQSGGTFKIGSKEYELAMEALREQDYSTLESRQSTVDGIITVMKQVQEESLPKEKKEKTEKANMILIDGVKMDRGDASAIYSRMSKKGVEYSTDGTKMYINDGKGYTEIRNLTTDESGTKEIWVSSGKITTNDAISRRGLSRFGTPYKQGTQNNTNANTGIPTGSNATSVYKSKVGTAKGSDARRKEMLEMQQNGYFTTRDLSLLRKHEINTLYNTKETQDQILQYQTRKAFDATKIK